MNDLTGKIYGRLIVIKRIENNKFGKSMYLCKCVCGKEKIVSSHNLKNSDVKSCGCLRKEGNNLKHGHYKNNKRSPTYYSWSSMNQRCNNKNCHEYKYYGKRGITICDRWSNKKFGFQNFLEDMGECPSGLSLDRIDNNKLKDGYSPDNCRWSTKLEQQKNKRNIKLFAYKGKIQNLKDWAKEYNIVYVTLWKRINKYKYK